MRRTGIEDTQIGVETGVNNLTYVDYTRSSQKIGIFGNTSEQSKICKCKSRLISKTGKNENNDNREKPNFKIARQDVEIMECYTFFSSLITQDGYCMKEIKR